MIWRTKDGDDVFHTTYIIRVSFLVATIHRHFVPETSNVASLPSDPMLETPLSGKIGEMKANFLTRKLEFAASGKVL